MYSRTPNIVPVRSPIKIEILMPERLDILKGGTLQLLHPVGVPFPSRMALGIFADHGADVDWKTRIARIPPDVVRKAMAKAPRFFVGGREERFDLVVVRNTPLRASATFPCRR